MLREIGLSEMIKRGIMKENCVFVARKRGNDELAPPDALFNDFEKRISISSAAKALPRHATGAYYSESQSDASAPRSRSMAQNRNEELTCRG
jgi:hypothetical protein